MSQAGANSSNGGGGTPGIIPGGPLFSNLGFAYDSGTGTFSVTGATASLSSSNPATIVLPSRTVPGHFTTYTVTADQSFTDGDLGTLVPQVWNWNPAGASMGDTPFFIYAFADDSGAIQFALATEPHYEITSSVICSNGGTTTANRYDFYQIQGTNADAGTQKPCLCIGSFRMQFSGTSWTVQTLSNTDGAGLFQENIRYSIPVSVLGANANSWIVADAGSPSVTATDYDYWMNKDGIVSIFLNMGLTPAAPNFDIFLVVSPWTKRATSSGFAYLDTSRTVLSQASPVTWMTYSDPAVPSAFRFQDQTANDITNSSVTGVSILFSTISFNMAQPA